MNDDSAYFNEINDRSGGNAWQLTPPSNLPRLPTDPESLAVELAKEPALFAYWQASAEGHRALLDRKRNQREFLKASTYLSAKGTVEERKATAAADPDVEALTEEMEFIEHRYRQALNEMTASDVRMTAIKKILSWRMEEAHSLTLGEPPARRIMGNTINFPSR